MSEYITKEKFDRLCGIITSYIISNGNDGVIDNKELIKELYDLRKENLK